MQRLQILDGARTAEVEGVLANADVAAVPEFGGGALIAQRAAIADVGVELDNRAEREALHLPARTFDRAVTEIQRKRGFGKQAAVVRLPGLAHDLAAASEYVVHQGAVDEPAIDHQLVDG